MTRQPSQSAPKQLGHPCACCGRHARTGRMVEGIGWVGPECGQKVAALHEVLKHEKLEHLLADRQPFELVEQTDAHGYPQLVYPAGVVRVMRRAQAVGLKFCARQIGESTRGEFWVRLPEGARARRALFAGLEPEKRVA